MRKLLFFIVLFVFASCNSVDQDKFEKVYRAGKFLSRSSYMNWEEIQSPISLLDIERSVASVKAKNERERQMLNLYGNAAMLFHSAAFRCKMDRIENIKTEGPNSCANIREVAAGQLEMAEEIYESGR